LASFNSRAIRVLADETFDSVLSVTVRQYCTTLRQFDPGLPPRQTGV